MGTNSHPINWNLGAMGVVHERRRSRHAPDARTVEDLLSAQRYHIDVPTEALDRTTGTGTHPVLTPPADVLAIPARPESTWSKVAKLAGLTTATSLLVGAVVASSVLTRERSEAAARPNPAPPQITGAAALGGFVPVDPAASQPSTGSSSRRYTSSAPTPKALAGAQVAGGGPAVLAASSPASTTTQAATSEDKIAVVERFYHRMVDQPEDALAMLAPDLAGDEPGDLVRAWSSMREVHVDEVQTQPDGTVRAVVTMLQRDGTKLRVTQLLGVSGATGDLITRAVLLSAEQL